MRGRLALAVVPPVDRPGRRALDFARWAVGEFGRPGGRPGIVVVDRTQKALTAAYGRGEGTVAWYMSQLRSAGVVLSSRPIVIDVQALGLPDAPTSEPDGDGEALPGPHESAALLARHAELVGQAAKLLAEMAALQANLLQVVVPAGARESANGIRESANAEFAELSEIRDIKEGRKSDSHHLPSFPAPRLAEHDSRNPRNSRNAGTAVDDVDRLVEPLRAFCRTTGRVDHLDDRGRGILAQLAPEALAAGAAAIQREATVDPRITRPLGLLIDRARKHDPTTFALADEPATGGRRPPAPACSDCGGTGFQDDLQHGIGTVVPCPCSGSPAVVP